MLRIGCHLSSAGGYLAMAREAKRLGADVFQFFTRNPRGGAMKALNPQDLESFRQFAAENAIGPILAHAPYTINAASSDPRIRAFALDTLASDLERMEATPGNLYNFHPGSHVKQGPEVGRQLIIDALNHVLRPEQSTTILLETMSGKGSEMGRDFQEIRSIIDGCSLNNKLGVCLDTCHIWDAGYDLAHNLDGIVEEFDRIIGLERLRAIHLNDSLNPCGAHKDRHAKIGEGEIGLEVLARVINHPQLRHLPFYLETPNDNDGYAREIALLREHYVA